jgi:hypothetical protein
MNRSASLILAAAIAATTLAGCASTGGTAAGQPSGNVTMDTGSPAPSSASPAAAESSAPCTTRSCIATDTRRNLVGLVAGDESVVTEATCKASSVKREAPGAWRVTCTATYSDGTVARGYASLLLSRDKLTWEPTEVLSGG